MYVYVNESKNILGKDELYVHNGYVEKTTVVNVDFEEMRYLSLAELQRWFWTVGNASFSYENQFIKDIKDENVHKHYEHGTREMFEFGLALGIVHYKVQEYCGSFLIHAETPREKACLDEISIYQNMSDISYMPSSYSQFVEYVEKLLNCIQPAGFAYSLCNIFPSQRKNFPLIASILQCNTKEFSERLSHREKLSLLVDDSLLKDFLEQHSK